MLGNEVTPTADQWELLQKLGGALRAASGYLTKLCPTEIPAQPVARLKLIESQLLKLSMALNIVRQPLLDFEQSLNTDQQSRLAVASSQGSFDRRQPQSGNIAGGCGSLSAIDWSINEINSISAVHHDAARLAQTIFGRGREGSRGTSSDDDPGHCAESLGHDSGPARFHLAGHAIDSGCAGEFRGRVSDAQKVRFDTMNFAAR